MNRQLQWDDLRVILAVAEAGSLSGAARRLGSSHATVFRRLADIEHRLGVALFERGRSGYTPTVAGEEAAAAAQRIEPEVLAIERRIAGRDLRPSGPVRVTTTDTLFFGLLSPAFADFSTAYPDIRLEITLSNEVFNLTRREADIAIRPIATPPENLVGRRVGVIAQAVYTAAAHPEPNAWVGPEESLGYRELALWMREHGHDAACRFRVDSVMGLLAAVRDGAGVGVLPCYLADAEPRLRRVGTPVDTLATDLWLLTHPDLRRTARIRAVLDVFADYIQGTGPRLAGQSA